MTEFFTVWNMIRCSGFLAFYFFTLSLALGLVSSYSIMKKKKGILVKAHQTSGWYGLLTTIFHVILIWKDQYVPYSLLEIIVPLTAKNQPILSAFGTAAFYLLLLVMISSDFFMKKIGINRWKKIHVAVIPAWIFMVLHGIFIGFDSFKPWAMFLYGSGISILILLGFIRYVEHISKQKHVPIK